MNRACRVFSVVVEDFRKGLFYKPKVGLYVYSKSLARRCLNFITFRKSIYPRYDYFWTNALQAIALLYVNCSDKEYESILVSFYHKRKSYPLDYVDSAMHGYVLLKLRERGVEEFDELLHQIFNFLRTQSKNTTKSILPYRRDAEYYFVDTLGMVCPFLVAYGIKFQKPEATNLALSQMIDFFENGMEDGLPYHAYDHKNNKLGNKAWGRGVCWMLWGMIDMLEYLPPENIHFMQIRDRYADLVDFVANRLVDLGFLGWDLLNIHSRKDHSVTAMFGYAVARGIKLGILDDRYKNILKRCSESVLNSTTEQGLVLDISGECLNLGDYSVNFGNYPWGQAPAAIMLHLSSQIEMSE